MIDCKKYFEVIAAELCCRVGLSFPTKTGKPYEVSDAEWTKAEEDDFRCWLTDYLKTVPKYKRQSIKRIKKIVDWFIFQYSWKYKEGEC